MVGSHRAERKITGRISWPDIFADVKRQHNTSGCNLERTSHWQVAAYQNGQITNKWWLRANRIDRKKKEICFANTIKSFAASSHSPQLALWCHEKKDNG